MQQVTRKERRIEAGMAAALVLIGVLVRAAALGSIPGGVNQDEAYSAYEAWCLMKDGMDSWGYRLPVYLRAWGSGMNALQSYLMIPFIALFGLKTWVIRLPQLIIACASLPAFYALMRRIAGRRAGLIGLFLLAISPWHVMLSRWGLESNLAPGLMLFGMLFFVMGVRDSRWFVFSGLFYGLSLYAYATIWPVVPAMLAMLLLFLVYTRSFVMNRYVAVGVGILFALAAMKNGAVFTGTDRLKAKESDRGMAMHEELSKLGGGLLFGDNVITVPRQTLHPTDMPLDGHNDHRIVMALSVILSQLGGTIDGAQATRKSYPGFFDDIKALGVEVDYQ